MTNRFVVSIGVAEESEDEDSTYIVTSSDERLRELQGWFSGLGRRMTWRTASAADEGDAISTSDLRAEYAWLSDLADAGGTPTA